VRALSRRRWCGFRLPKPFECGLGQRPGTGLSLGRPLLESTDDARHLGDKIEAEEAAPAWPRLERADV
jgi:hypothetical protein